MKGPFQRLKWDLRRGWECPVCQRRERTPGTATFRHCLCQMQKLDGKPIVMKLVEDEPPHLRPLLPTHRCPVAANASDASLLGPAEDAPPGESG